MGKPAARQGDTTAHGGVITVGAPTVLIGGQPAARIGDMHTCPMQTPGTPPIPHVGGPVTGPGAPTVLICGQPAAVVGDMATCTDPPDSVIPPGCPTVLIGQGGGGGGAGGAGGGAEADATADAGEVAESHFLHVKFVDKGGKPITGVAYTVKSPDKKLMRGTLTGEIKRTGLKEGNYEITLKAITKAQWSTQEARVGDKVTLTAETAGIASGEKATLQVFIKDSNFADHLLATIPSKVSGDKVEEEWQLEVDDPLLSDQQTKRGQGGYSSPTFYFVITAAGVSARSGLLVYKDYIELELADDEGNPQGNVKYKVYLPNGAIREGKLDGNGYAKVDNVPPGEVEVVFDTRESE